MSLIEQVKEKLVITEKLSIIDVGENERLINTVILQTAMECDKNKNQPSIDRVTTSNLDAALRMCGMNFGKKTVDKIIDLVELIEEKGNEVNIGDIEELKAEWDERSGYGN